MTISPGLMGPEQAGEKSVHEGIGLNICKASQGTIQAMAFQRLAHQSLSTAREIEAAMGERTEPGFEWAASTY